jgi:hypothetical protein
MAKRTQKTNHASQSRLKPGDKVMIRRNPHRADAREIIGTLVQLRVGQEFGGCNLADVRYTRPLDGRSYTMPFAPSCLRLAPPRVLLTLARYDEATDARIRRLL